MLRDSRDEPLTFFLTKFLPFTLGRLPVASGPRALAMALEPSAAGGLPAPPGQSSVASLVTAGLAVDRSPAYPASARRSRRGPGAPPLLRDPAPCFCVPATISVSRIQSLPDVHAFRLLLPRSEVSSPHSPRLALLTLQGSS